MDLMGHMLTQSYTHTHTNATVRAIHFKKIYQQKIYQAIQATPKIYQVIQAYPVIPSICAKEASLANLPLASEL